MSRVSLNRRLEAVLAAAERVNPQAAAVYRLPPGLRQRYDAWRAQCDAVQSQYGEGGALYEAMLSGELVTPDPPRAVAEALGVADAGPIVTDAMTLQQVADLWADMVEE